MYRVIKITVFCGFVAIIALAVAARIATSSAMQNIGDPPSDLPVESATIIDQSGKSIGAWTINGDANRGIVLLLHGIRSDRRSMIDRARLLYRAGYSVLMIDLQAHGESAGERITFGYLEAQSVAAAIKFARTRWPEERLAVIGSSLGGAAAVYAAKYQRADLYILEAVYSNLRDATENRLRIKFGIFGPFLAPLLLWQTPLQLGFHSDEMSTVDQIAQLDAPLLIIAGEKDRRTTLDNTNALFSSAMNPKMLWVIQDAVHQDFLQFSKIEYQKRVLNFLKNNLH